MIPTTITGEFSDPVSLVLSIVESSHSIDEVKEVLQRNCGDADTSINELLDNSSSHLHSVPGPSTSMFPSSQISVTSPSLAEILRAHCQKTISNRVYDMEINRSHLWQQASIFYKCALQSLECLSYKFAVEFIGEEGVDAGMQLQTVHDCTELMHILIQEQSRMNFLNSCWDT